MDELQLHNFTALFEKKLLSHKRHTETQRFVPLVKIKDDLIYYCCTVEFSYISM